jgi:hypothetical protein
MRLENKINLSFIDYFLKKDVVTWNDFLNAFSKLLELIPPQYRNHPMSFLLSQHPEVIDEETEMNIKCLKAILGKLLP